MVVSSSKKTLVDSVYMNTMSTATLEGYRRRKAYMCGVDLSNTHDRYTNSGCSCYSDYFIGYLFSWVAPSIVGVKPEKCCDLYISP